MRFSFKLIVIYGTISPSITAVAGDKRMLIDDDEFLSQTQAALDLSTVELTETDIIYARHGFPILSPVVVEKYKIVFFPVAKVASSEWIRMLVRMGGSNDWCAPWIHRPDVNKLKRLNDYSIMQATEIMTSSNWTRAVFVRNPHDRVLSAYLDKAVRHSERFAKAQCHAYGYKGGDVDECISNHTNFDFFLRNITTILSDNEHWSPIYDHIDEKWWARMDFIGYFDNLRGDAEKLLKMIHSEDGVSAWSKWGVTGWSARNNNCTDIQNQSFLGMNDPLHHTDARQKLRKFYTASLDAFVREKYANDLNNPYFNSTSYDLFP